METNIIKSLVEDYKLAKRSTIFWNLLIFIIWGVSWFIDYQIPIVMSLIGSFILLIILVDQVELKNGSAYWVILTQLFWLLCLISLLMFGGVFIWKNTIVKFNKWLDNEKS